MIDGQRIEALMKERGINQAELARRIGVAQPTIFKMIRENKTGSVHLHKVARELQTTTDYLTRETDDPEGDAPSPLFTADERELVELLRGMAPKDRGALMQLARTIASSAASATVHNERHEFRGQS